METTPEEQRCPDCNKMLGEVQGGTVHIRHGDHHALVTLAWICTKCGKVTPINNPSQATLAFTAQKAVNDEKP